MSTNFNSLKSKQMLLQYIYSKIDAKCVQFEMSLPLSLLLIVPTNGAVVVMYVDTGNVCLLLVHHRSYQWV